MNDKIWIGYFDEGIFGAFTQTPKSERYGPSGLARLTDQGEIEFSYNRQFAETFISDIHALTLDDDNRIWFCPYTYFFVASVSANTVRNEFARAPATGADALCVGANHVAFFGGYQQRSMVALLEKSSERVRLIQLLGNEGEPLVHAHVATRGSQAIMSVDSRLYDVSIASLLNALGPWTDNNATTLESAVQYITEEESYSESYAIIQSDGKTTSSIVPGVPRPPENPPRRDNN